MVRLFQSPANRRLTLVLGLVLLLTILGFVLRDKRSGSVSPNKPEVFHVLPPRAKILAEVEPESIEQTIDALPTFLDRGLAQSAPGLPVPCPDLYGYARVVVPRLTRVRKLLGQIPEERRPYYSDVFLKKLAECAQGFRQSRKEFFDTYDKAGGSLMLSEPPPYYKKRDTATALVYILTEWDRPEAVPAFVRLLDESDPLPVSRLFLLYSTHLLVGSLPTSGFSQAKLNQLAAYRKLAGFVFPEVERTSVPVWNAGYEETDFRAVILGQPVPIASQPTIRLRLYPNIDRLEDFNTGELDLLADAVQRTLLALLSE